MLGLCVSRCLPTSPVDFEQLMVWMWHGGLKAGRLCRSDAMFHLYYDI